MKGGGRICRSEQQMRRILCALLLLFAVGVPVARAEDDDPTGNPFCKDQLELEFRHAGLDNPSGQPNPGAPQDAWSQPGTPTVGIHQAYCALGEFKPDLPRGTRIIPPGVTQTRAILRRIYIDPNTFDPIPEVRMSLQGMVTSWPMATPTEIGAETAYVTRWVPLDPVALSGFLQVLTLPPASSGEGLGDCYRTADNMYGFGFGCPNS